jgi:23S rRNA pseudouridine1911/1915/1917 synthase
MELPILYENDDLVAVAKPAGLMTHGDGRSSEPTVADWFAARYPASAGVGETQRLADGMELPRPGVVHRLDRETSGVLVLAKTADAHAFLKAAFHDREAKKTYLAFVYGVMPEEKGTISLPIGRSRKDFRLRSAQPKARGMLRDAITRYEVIAPDADGTHSLVYVYPETGRTHQIRVHMKAVHHPVVGDPLYAPNHAADLGFDRLGLHAFRLDLPLPSGGRTLITAPVPDELAAALPRFGEAATAVAGA